MRKHTTERWEVKHDFRGDLIVVAVSGKWKGWTIVSTFGPGEGKLSRANLIADAPKTAAERDRLKALNAGLIETMQELLRLVPEPSRHLPVGKLFAHNRIVGDAERAIAKAEGEPCTTPK